MKTNTDARLNRRAAMIIAHPGHELRVHHWVESARPEVLVLTDGSGRTGKSRLDSTTGILQRAGATPGPVYGRFTDATIYQCMLQGRPEPLLDLLDEVTAWLIDRQVESVAGDALEGYNTSHEVCRYLIGAACERVRRQTGRELANFDFLLVGRPDECPAELQAQAIHLALDEAAVERKLAAAQGYPELAHEVASALQQFGQALFAHEWLRPASNRAGLDVSPGETPFYERYGEQQKAAGHYRHVIRQREHVLPLARALWDHATR